MILLENKLKDFGRQQVNNFSYLVHPQRTIHPFIDITITFIIESKSAGVNAISANVSIFFKSRDFVSCIWQHLKLQMLVDVAEGHDATYPDIRAVFWVASSQNTEDLFELPLVGDTVDI